MFVTEKFNFTIFVHNTHFKITKIRIENSLRTQL